MSDQQPMSGGQGRGGTGGRLPRLIIVTSSRGAAAPAGLPADVASGLLASASVNHFDVHFCDTAGLRRLNPGPGALVAVSGAYTQFIGAAYRASRYARRRGALSVMGGQHVSALPDEALRHCDGVVRGEAETVWPLVIGDFLAGKLRPVYEGEPAAEILPDFYLDYLLEDERRAPFVEAVRGCSRSCEFCSVTSHFGAPRFAGLSRLDRLLRAVGDRRIVRFTAPDIFVDEAYFRELCALCRRHGTRWKAYSGLAIAASDEALDLARQSGCFKLEIGFEDFDPANTPKIAQAAGARVSFEDLAARVRSHGINLIAYLIVGGDNLRVRDYGRHFRFVLSRRCSACSTFMVTPFPGSRLYERLRREGRLRRRAWISYNRLWVVFRPRIPGAVLYAIFALLNLFGELLPARKADGVVGKVGRDSSARSSLTSAP